MGANQYAYNVRYDDIDEYEYHEDPNEYEYHEDPNEYEYHEDPEEFEDPREFEELEESEEYEGPEEFEEPQSPWYLEELYEKEGRMTCGCRDQCECSDERLLYLRINGLENYVGADFLTPDDKKKMLERIQFERQNGLLS